jgi:hypothetical protein
MRARPCFVGEAAFEIFLANSSGGISARIISWYGLC